MIHSSFLWCFFFFASVRASWGYEDPFIIPECENKGPDDVYLDFSGGDLGKLTGSYIVESSIKCLNYKNNQIREIASDAFNKVQQLYYLNLARNSIKFEDLMRSNIRNLETLILDGPFNYDRDSHYYDTRNDYENQRGGYFENVYHGELLSLPKLKKLSLSHYGPTYSQRSNFRLTVLDVPMLTHLYLSGNYLTTIANLEKMPKLTHLNLDDNRIAYIPGSLLKNLEYLSMNDNIIESVCRTTCILHSIAPREMHNLKYLSLAANNIRNIDSDAFADLENLLVLNLKENKINDFQQHTFDNMTKLQNLTLDKNNLTRVPDISALQELEILSLNENRIMVIDEMTFSNMPKLAVVYMRKNGVTTIADMAFGNLPVLTNLDLSFNDIDFLPEEWILPNDSLKVLLLDHNQFTDIGNMTLEQLHNLQILGLAYNPIEKISVRSMMKLAADAVIDISGSMLNPEDDFRNLRR